MPFWVTPHGSGRDTCTAHTTTVARNPETRCCRMLTCAACRVDGRCLGLSVLGHTHAGSASSRSGLRLLQSPGAIIGLMLTALKLNSDRWTLLRPRTPPFDYRSTLPNPTAHAHDVASYASRAAHGFSHNSIHTTCCTEAHGSYRCPDAPARTKRTRGPGCGPQIGSEAARMRNVLDAVTMPNVSIVLV